MSPVYIDPKEQGEAGRRLKMLADAVVSLSYEDGDRTLFYDARVEPLDGGEPVRVERKVFPSDFLGSWWSSGAEKDKLERQSLAVDLLILEWNTMADWGAPDAELARVVDLKSRVFKHVANMAFKMPVTFTDGPDNTMAVLRYLERTPHARSGVFTRRKKVKSLGQTP